MIPAPTTKPMEKLQQIADAPGPVPVADLRASKITLNRIVVGGWAEKEKIDGKSHYRLTAKGVRVVAAADRARRADHEVAILDPTGERAGTAALIEALAEQTEAHAALPPIPVLRLLPVLAAVRRRLS